MENTLKKYDLDKMIEVANDRLGDYSENVSKYEEKYAGEIEVNPDKYYKYGYEQTLTDIVKMLTKLKSLHISSIEDAKEIECPCCEHKSTKAKWNELRSDDFLLCPVCDNTCTYDEFKENQFA